MEDIEVFTTTYRARLDEAELAKSIPENVYLEVFTSISFSNIIVALLYLSICSVSIL